MSILHVEGDDVSAEQGTALVRRTGPGRPVLHRLRSRQDPGYRRRALGAEGHHAAFPQPGAVFGGRSTARTYPHDERYAVVAIRGRTAHPWCATDQYFAGYARPRQI